MLKNTNNIITVEFEIKIKVYSQKLDFYKHQKGYFLLIL